MKNALSIALSLCVLSGVSYAQTTDSDATEYQTMSFEEMQNDPLFKQLMQNPEIQQLNPQGLSVQEAMRKNQQMMGGVVEFMKCLDAKAGAGTSDRVMQLAANEGFEQYAHQAYQRIIPYCEAGKHDAANAYIEKAMDVYAKKTLSSKEYSATKSCETLKTKAFKDVGNVCDSYLLDQTPN